MGRARIDRREPRTRSLNSGPRRPPASASSRFSVSRALRAGPRRIIAGVLFVIVSAALLATAPAQAQTVTRDVWTATLTVDNDNNHVLLGCDDGGSADGLDACSTALSDNDFVYKGTTYRITEFAYVPFLKNLDVEFAQQNVRTDLRSLTLHTDTATYFVSLAGPSGSTFPKRMRWENVNLSWSPGDTVAVKFTEPLPKPAKPAGFMATAGAGQVALSWSDPSDSSITKYQYRQKVGSAAWGAWTDIPSSASGGTNATSFTVASLMNGTAYRFRIRAVNAAGNGAPSDIAGPVTPTAADTTRPTVVAGSTGYYSSAALTTALSGTQSAGTDIYTKVTFSEDMKQVASNTASARPQLYYRIGTIDTQYDILASGGTLASGDCKPNHATETDEYICRYTVIASDSGAFRVKAGTGSEDEAGNALAAAYTHATSLTLPVLSAPPAKPAGLTATAGNAQVALSWTNPNDATITKYQYQQKAGSAAWGSWTNIPTSAHGQANAASFTVTSLMNGTAYRFRIRAVNAAGNSQQSDRSASVTPAVPPAAVPDVTAIAVTSSPPSSPGGWYKLNGVIKVELTFDEIITVSGSPALAITVGSAAKSASCARKGDTGDNRKVLVCSYTVVDGDEDTDGVSVAANKLTLPSSATIKDSDSNDANRTHSALPAQSGHKVDAKAPSLTLGAPTPAGPAKSKSITNTASDSGSGLGGTGASLWFVNASTTCDDASYLAAFASTSSGVGAEVDSTLYATPTYTLSAERYNGWYMCAAVGDNTGNGRYAKSAQITGIDTTAPTVTAASTGYFSSPTLATALTGTQSVGTDIYTKVTFSEDMKQVASNAAAARPQLYYRIGTTDTQYDILPPGGTLGSGDCKPNHATETDEYICGYTVGATDDGAFRVKVGTGSEDEAGNALASVYTHATSLTFSAPTTAPAKPTGLTAQAGNAQVALSWTNPNDATITKYQYQQKAGSAAWGSWTNIANSAPGETNATSFTVTSLMNGTAYRFRIRAVNVAGNSQQSDASASVTPAVPPAAVPDVTAIAMGSSPPGPQGGWYKKDNVIKVELTFDEIITVSGSPALAITVGSAAKSASCARKGSTGDNRKVLVCSYTVVDGDEDTDGVSVAANKLTLPSSATIKDSDSNDATRAHSALPAQSGHKVDAKAPTLTVGAPTPTGPAKSKSITATAADTGVGLEASDNAYWFEDAATTCDRTSYIDNSANRTRFTSGTPVVINSETRNGEYICFVAVDGLGSNGYAKSAEITGIDTTDPGIAFPSGVTPTTGTAASITLTDSGSKVKRYGAIVVVGTKTNANDCNTAAKVGNDNLTSVTPASPVNFSYTPPADSATKKVCAYAEDAAGNSHAALWGTAIAQAAAVDNTGPTISTVAVTSTVPSDQNGHYRIGDAIAVTVTFNEGIVVTGSPVLKLRVGTAERDATCARKGASGDDAKKLVCSYTVVEGDADTDGIAVEAGKLTGTIKDSSTNDATLTYTALGNQSGHKVDGVRPTITGLTGLDQLFTGDEYLRIHVEFSEEVKVTGRPTLAIRVGSTARTATFSIGGQTATSKPFDYLVQAGEEDADGVGVDAGSVTLPSGASVKDRAGNAAVLTHSGAVAVSTKVDAVKPSVGFPPTGPWLGREARITLRDATSKVKRYGAIAVAGTETDATGCNTATKVGNANLTTLSTPASPETLRYTPPSGSSGKKVCVFVQDAAANIHAALWTTAIAEPPAVPPPAAPEALKALGSTSGPASVVLNWNEAGDDTITKYQVDWRETGESGENWRDIPGSNALTTRHTVEGLENGTEYAFRVRAVNDGGPGAASATAWAAPGRVTVQGITLARFQVEPGEDRLELRWSKLNTFLCGYVIQWRVTGSTEWQSHEFESQLRRPKYTIGHLKAGTSYDVRLLVNAGTGNQAPGLAWERTRTTTATSEAPPVTGPAPALEWARVNGAELALRFDAPLDESSAPAGSAFAVSVAGAARTVSAVSVSRDTATLTLASAAASGEAVTVGYTPPATGRLRGAGGGDVAAFSGQAVANDTPSPQVRAALTASVSSAPSEHRGKGRFVMRVAFSEGVTAKAKDAGVEVSGGTLVRAARVDRRADLWELRIAPAGQGAVTVTLPAASDCTASGAICTADGRKLETALTHTVAGPAPPAPAGLTASVSSAPAEHRGEGRFAVRIAFSEAVTAKAKNAGVQVSGGTLARAVRVDGRKNLWELRVAPSGYEAVTVTLPATADCAAAGAVCTADGRKLATALTHTVPGPVALSVADARAKEGEDAAIDFAVTLSRAASGEVTVRYATRDGTAKKGKDYTRAKGTLTFAAGETAKTVSVAVLDDAKDEGEETFRLVLSKPKGAIIADGEAVGTIENDDPMPAAWLARFGRTVAGQAVDAVTARLEGGGGSHLTLGGQSLSLDTPQGQAQAADELEAVAAALGADTPGDGFDRERWMRGGNPAASSRTMTGRELLLGSAFHLQSGGEAGGPGFAAWGRVAHGSFDGAEDGVTMDGEVTTGFLGADVSSGRWLAGAAVARSQGEGTFALSGDTAGESAFDRGEIESTLTSVLPYGRIDLSERVTAWGMLGYGTGELVLTEKGGTATDRHEADLTMTLGAVGGRGTLVPAPEGGGFALALRTDAFWVRTESDATEGMAAAKGDATRLRLILDASRPVTLGAGTLTPSLEAGLRHDGGDAETGTGIELGAGLAWTDPESGVTMEARARWLAAHEASGYEEWGVSGSVRVDPGERGRGLSFSLAPTVGNAGSGTGNLWSAADARGLAPGGEFEAARGLDAEVGYGMALFGDRFTGTPNLGVALSDGARAYRLGWRLTSAVPNDPGFEIGLDATRSESANDNEPEHGVMLRGAIRW